MTTSPHFRRPARILIVEDETMYRSLLRDHLERTGYQVLEAPDGLQGLEMATQHEPDLVILDICMPGLDGFTVCRKLREQDSTRELGILLLTGLSDRNSRVEGLTAGADDFLSKPVYSAELLTRVRNLLKLKFLKDQLDAVQTSVQEMLTPEPTARAKDRLLLACSDEISLELSQLLEAGRYEVSNCLPAFAVEAALACIPDLVILQSEEPLETTLRTSRKLRQQKALRTVPVLLFGPPLDTLQRSATFEAGIDECLSRPIHPLELSSRMSLHVRHQHEQRHLEERLHNAAQRAILDGLTGAHNRAFFDHYLDYQCKLSARQSKPLSIILLDLDHFKSINDSFGHSYGDAVLRKVVDLIRSSIRASDVLCRYGGEEFALLLPDTNREDAHVVAERIRTTVATPQHWEPLPTLVTVSLGIATFGLDATSAPALIDIADQALYRAKEGGRNRSAFPEHTPQLPNVQPFVRTPAPPPQRSAQSQD